MKIFTPVIVLAVFLAIAEAIADGQSVPLKVRLYVFVHDNVTEKYRTSVIVPVESSILDVLIKASLDPVFKYEPVDGPKITKIGSNQENPGNSEYWNFYVLNTAPTTQNLPNAAQVVSEGTMLDTLQSMNAGNEMHYLFWLRH